MSKLLVIKKPGLEETSSEELEYANRILLHEIRAVFGSVDLATSGVIDNVSSYENVLFIGEPGIFVSRESLEAMLGSVQLEGTHIIVPRAIQLAPLERYEPFHTLRGFRRVEGLLLNSDENSDSSVYSESPNSHFPVSLFKTKVFDQIETLDCFQDGALLKRLQNLGYNVKSKGFYFRSIDYYGSERVDLLPFIPENAMEVLDVGCGRGNTGRMLQDTLGCRVSGVELNPVIAEDAKRKLYKVFTGPLQSMEIQDQYDVILAADVLEHQDDVPAFLTDMYKLLNPGGRIVLSLPNVGHYSIVEDLIAGHWDYVPIGLLCITHLRFFTQATIEDWLNQMGFERFEVYPRQQTELPDRFLKLVRDFEANENSLRTLGFYIVIHSQEIDR